MVTYGSIIVSSHLEMPTIRVEKKKKKAKAKNRGLGGKRNCSRVIMFATNIP
jgi:hypothetical protein